MDSPGLVWINMDYGGLALAWIRMSWYGLGGISLNEQYHGLALTVMGQCVCRPSRAKLQSLLAVYSPLSGQPAVQSYGILKTERRGEYKYTAHRI